MPGEPGPSPIQNPKAPTSTEQHLRTLWQEAGQAADAANAELPEMQRRAAALRRGDPASQTGQIEKYDPNAETFPTYLQRNNDAIIQRYAGTIHQLLTTRPDLISNDKAFYEAINPAKRQVDPPLSLDEQHQLVQRLDQLALSGVGGKPLALEPGKLRAEIAKGEQRALGGNYHLRGTGEQSEVTGRPTLRKIYLSPDIRGIDRFTQKLYEGLEQNNIRIYGSKIHTDDFETDANGAIVKQGHNTMVVYVENDLATQRVIQTILEAERQSGVPLATYSEDEVLKTALIEGKMMVGVDEADAQLSFDNIANSLANKGRKLWRDGKVPTVDEVRAEMDGELDFRNGKKPTEYLSLSTTAKEAALAEADAQALDRVRGRLKELSSSEQMSDRVFDAVYQQLAKADTKRPSEKRGAKFRDDVVDGWDRHVRTVEEAGVTNVDLFHELWGKMSEYAASNPADAARRQQEATKMYQALTGHVNGLVQRGEVDPLVAKVFLRSIPSLKFIGQTNYNDIVRHSAPLGGEDLREKNQAFVQETRSLWDSYPEDAREEQVGGVLHFNNNVKGGVRHRVYISAALDQAPDQVVKAWRDSLEATGMHDRVYFKLPEGLSNRSETIIVYPTEGVPDEDIGRLFADFTSRCPPELLAESSIPTAIPIDRGIGIAPEPANINRLIRYMGLEDKNVSYNQLVTSLTQLSFEVAYGQQQRANPTALVTPKELQPQARTYFTQMAKLCGLNSATMMPNSQGGEFPAWTEAISKAA